MRILIADQHPKARFALRVVLEQRLGFKTIGEAIDTDDLLAQVKTFCPDLVLVDWELPGIPPTESIGTLRQTCAKLRIIVLNTHAETREHAIAAGADAFVCKCDAPDDLLSAIDRCLKAREPSSGQGDN